MEPAPVAVSAALALPAGYLVGLLVDRIPDALPLRSDLPGLRMTGKYLTGHVLTLVTFVVLAVRFDQQDFVGKSGWLVLIPMLIAATSMIALAIMDVETYRLPDRLVLPTFLVTLVLITLASVIGRDSRSILYALARAALARLLLRFVPLSFDT